MPAERRLSAFSVSDEPPENPFNGEHWIDATSGIEYIWCDLSDFWVEGGSSADFPDSPSPSERFDYADKQWIWNGIGWALVKLFREDEYGNVATDRPLVANGANISASILDHEERIAALEDTIDGGTF